MGCQISGYSISGQTTIHFISSKNVGFEIKHKNGIYYIIFCYDPTLFPGLYSTYESKATR